MEVSIDDYLSMPIWTSEQAACLLASQHPAPQKNEKVVAYKPGNDSRSISGFALRPSKTNLNFMVYNAELAYTQSLTRREPSKSPLEWVNYSLENNWYPRWLYLSSKNKEFKSILDLHFGITTAQRNGGRSDRGHYNIKTIAIAEFTAWFKDPQKFKNRDEFTGYFYDKNDPAKVHLDTLRLWIFDIINIFFNRVDRPFHGDFFRKYHEKHRYELLSSDYYNTNFDQMEKRLGISSSELDVCGLKKSGFKHLRLDSID